MTPKKVVAVDLFAGAGGMSTGLALACKQLGRPVELVAINHWKEAVETHEKNHPWATHLREDVLAVDPRRAVPGGRVNVLTAGPECTHHSRAAGGRPLNDQSRASAWHIMRWLELLRVDNLLVENVPEFRDWGPLNASMRPIERLKGTVYESWIRAIRSFGYNVDTRVLNAADYGAPTSRSRLFIMAKRGNRPIRWPEPTRKKNGKGRRRWRAAREIIDWSIEGESIFTRKRPLKPRTVARIMEGLRRFGGAEIRPFIVLMEHGRNDDGSVRIGSKVRSVEDPLPAITSARGGSMGLVKPGPFILSQGSNGAPKSVDGDPVPAIMTGGKHALVEPFILSQGSGGAPRSTKDPVATIPTKGAHSLIEPYLVEYHAGEGGDKRVGSIDAPLKTVDTSNRYALAQPFLLPVRGFFGQNAPKSVEEPLGTITQRGYGAVVEPYIVRFNGTSDSQVRGCTTGIQEPLGAVTGSGHYGLAEPFLASYYGSPRGGVTSVEDPVPTLTGKERFGLVQPVIGSRRLDIRFRMLQPHELAGAMGFPATYEFVGTKADVVKQIGNAVAVDVARALALSLLREARGGVLRV